MPEQNLRAWVVTDAVGSQVVFAPTRDEALGAVEEPQMVPTNPSISVRRVKEFDQYAEVGRVPARVLVEKGWQVPCRRCGELVSEDDRRVGAEIEDEALCAMCVPEVYEVMDDGVGRLGCCRVYRPGPGHVGRVGGAERWLNGDPDS
jgi:hypothetical protein